MKEMVDQSGNSMNVVTASSKPSMEIYCTVNKSILNNFLGIRKPERLFYTRVPKCASSMVLKLTKTACEHNDCIYKTTAFDPNRGITKIYNPSKISKSLSSAKTPSYGPNGHIYFINFTAFGYKMPEYFSIVRDPFEHRVSSYYYKARREDKKYKNVTFDQCMQSNLTLCRNKYHDNSKFNILTYFCGFPQHCFRNTRETLTKAIQNVERYYGVVGIVEDMGAFTELLEETYPTYFHRILDHLKQTPRQNDFSWFKTSLNDKSKHFVMSQLDLDYEFYGFIKQRFYQQYNAMKAMKGLYLQ